MKTQNRKGFAAFELLVVIVIIGLLAAVSIPTFISAQHRHEQLYPAQAEKGTTAAGRFQVTSPEQALDGPSYTTVYVIRDTVTGNSYMIINNSRGIAIAPIVK